MHERIQETVITVGSARRALPSRLGHISSSSPQQQQQQQSSPDIARLQQSSCAFRSRQPRPLPPPTSIAVASCNPPCTIVSSVSLPCQCARASTCCRLSGRGIRECRIQLLQRVRQHKQRISSVRDGCSGTILLKLVTERLVIFRNVFGVVCQHTHPQLQSRALSLRGHQVSPQLTTVTLSRSSSLARSPTRPKEQEQRASPIATSSACSQRTEVEMRGQARAPAKEHPLRARRARAAAAEVRLRHDARFWAPATPRLRRLVALWIQPGDERCAIEGHCADESREVERWIQRAWRRRIKRERMG